MRDMKETECSDRMSRKPHLGKVVREALANEGTV